MEDDEVTGVRVLHTLSLTLPLFFPNSGGYRKGSVHSLTTTEHAFVTCPK